MIPLDTRLVLKSAPFGMVWTVTEIKPKSYILTCTASMSNYQLGRKSEVEHDIVKKSYQVVK